MPPKRKVPARRTASTGKKVRIGNSSVIPTTPTTASGRPRRGVAVDINYKLTPTRVPNGALKTQTNPSQDIPAPKAVKQATADTPKKRGRPAKNAGATNTTTSASLLKTDATTGETPVKPVRGRPRKSDAAAAESTVTTQSKKRKNDADESVDAPPRKRGRPAKNITKAATNPEQPPPIKLRNGESKTTPNTKLRIAAKTSVNPSKRGRPAKSATAPTTVSAAKTTSKRGPKTKAAKDPKIVPGDFEEGLSQPIDLIEDAGDTQYWLMKAEPDQRLEKGKDVSFPIDKLAAATEPEPWDGVRNPVARNKMRAMRKGDLAFFYHSSCAVPGIVGVMRIAEEHSVDESAFDPEHPYFDEKSTREKPKWDCVKVEFVKKFNDIVALKELKSTPELSNMQIAQKAYGRLSVQSVTPAQWRFVLKMANEPEDLGVTSAVSGYEADTNGETDKEDMSEGVGVDDRDDADAARLAAYGSPDEAVNGEDGMAIDNATPQTNGHIVSETVTTVAETNRMDSLGRDDVMISAEEG